MNDYPLIAQIEAAEQAELERAAAMGYDGPAWELNPVFISDFVARRAASLDEAARFQLFMCTPYDAWQICAPKFCGDATYSKLASWLVGFVDSYFLQATDFFNPADFMSDAAHLRVVYRAWRGYADAVQILRKMLRGWFMSH